MNIGILGISELKWMGMDKLNSDDHYIYYCGQESLNRNGVVLIVNKRVQNAVLGCNLKNERMILICFQGKSFSITVIQVYPPNTDAKKAEVERFYEDLQDLLELTHTYTHTHKCHFHHRRLEYKNRKSRDTWSNRRVWPWSKKMKQGKSLQSFVKRTHWLWFF